MTLISVLGVMNGFQLGFIEDILSISSYHLRITLPGGKLTTAELGRMRSVPGVKAVVPFLDIQTLITGRLSDFHAALVRGVPANVARLDPGLARHLNPIEGSLYLAGDHSIVIGFELARTLGVKVGDSVSIVSLSGNDVGGLSPENVPFTVTGIFKSGYYQFDETLCFVTIQAARLLGSNAEDLVYGVKLDNRFHDRTLSRRIADAFPSLKLHVESWRTYNSAFFGALRMEKLVMSILLALIFLVVGANIYHFLQRAVYERREEIGILRSLGASPPSMQAVFIFDGFYIGVLGSTIGLILGLLISDHINEIFSFVELLINIVLTFVSALAMPFGKTGGFPVFPSALFYLNRVPSRVLFHEALLIYLFGIITSGAAAFFASRKAAEIKPQEVLRYE
jgi:lipoprotein-releasing system permease protein